MSAANSERRVATSLIRRPARRVAASVRPQWCSPKLQFASDLYGAFSVKGPFPRGWAVDPLMVLGFADSSLFGAGKAVLRPIACDQVPAARGRGHGTETLAQLGGVPP